MRPAIVASVRPVILPGLRTLPALATFCLAALAAGTAGAQPGDPQKVDPQKAAEGLVAQARAAMDHKDYAAACPKLEEVTRLVPGGVPTGVAGRLLLGQCYEGQGRLASAWTTYEIAQTMAAQAKDANQEKLAHERADALKPRLAHLLVTVPEALRAAPGLTITVDGIPVGAAQPFPVDRGQHVVAAVAAGRPKWQHAVEVPADGASISVEVLAVADIPPTAPPAVPAPLPAGAAVAPVTPVGPVAPPAPEPPPAPPSDSAPRALEYTMFGLAGVGAIVGISFAALGLSAKNAYNAKPTTSGADKTDTDALAADVGFASVLVFGVGGVVMLLTNRHASERARADHAPAASLFVTPRVGMTGGGAAVGLHF